MHACPCHDPWKRLWMAKSRKGETWVPDAIIGTNQLRETTPLPWRTWDFHPRSSKVAGGQAQGQQPRLIKMDKAKNSRQKNV